MLVNGNRRRETWDLLGLNGEGGGVWRVSVCDSVCACVVRFALNGTGVDAFLYMRVFGCVIVIKLVSSRLLFFIPLDS